MTDHLTICVYVVGALPFAVESHRGGLSWASAISGAVIWPVYAAWAGAQKYAEELAKRAVEKQAGKE